MASRSTRTKGGVATQTARGSPSSSLQSNLKQTKYLSISMSCWVLIHDGGYNSQLDTGLIRRTLTINRKEILSYCSDCHCFIMHQLNVLISLYTWGLFYWCVVPVCSFLWGSLTLSYFRQTQNSAQLIVLSSVCLYSVPQYICIAEAYLAFSRLWRLLVRVNKLLVYPCDWSLSSYYD